FPVGVAGVQQGHGLEVRGKAGQAGTVVGKFLKGEVQPLVEGKPKMSIDTVLEGQLPIHDKIRQEGGIENLGYRTQLKYPILVLNGKQGVVFPQDSIVLHPISLYKGKGHLEFFRKTLGPAVNQIRKSQSQVATFQTVDRSLSCFVPTTPHGGKKKDSD